MLTRTNTFIVSAMALAYMGCTSDKGTDDTDTPDTDTDEQTDDTSSSGDDADGDGWASDEDCDDNDADANPGADEECDGNDNDCDGEIDEDVTETYWEDADGDGFGDEGSTTDACEPPTGYVPAGDGDCDDADSTVYPGAEELCDSIDNDCDDEVDEDLGSSTWYADADGDGYGNPGSSTDACEQPAGYTNNDWDCDDTDEGEPVHVSADGTVPSSGSGPDTADSGGGPPDTGPGSAYAPFSSVQDGIDAANVCVHVYSGDYTL